MAPSPLQLALHRVSNVQAATTALLAPLHGLVSIAVVAATALTALALQRPAPSKCLQLADGALYKSKALHSSWKQPTASTTASGTLRQATACSANARPIQNSVHFFYMSRSLLHAPRDTHCPGAHCPASSPLRLRVGRIGAGTYRYGYGVGRVWGGWGRTIVFTLLQVEKVVQCVAYQYSYCKDNLPVFGLRQKKGG